MAILLNRRLEVMADNAEQIADWNGPLGERWANLQAQFDALTRPFGDAAIAAAAAQAGERVLDVGCGCGDTSFALAKTVGPTGAVLGVDISRPMLEVARHQAVGADNITFEEADASIAPLPADRDLLFSRFGVMFFEEPVPAFIHLRGALKPGGRTAFCCWRTPKENPWAGVPMAAVREALNITEPPQHPHAPGPFAFADAGRLQGILADAGFSDINIEAFDAHVRQGDSPRQTAEFAARMGPAGRLIRDAGMEHLPKALDAIEAAFGPLTAPDGSVSLTGGVWIVTASNRGSR
jgi:SAM-dependent methyltransferase